MKNLDYSLNKYLDILDQVDEFLKQRQKDVSVNMPESPEDYLIDDSESPEDNIID